MPDTYDCYLYDQAPFSTTWTRTGSTLKRTVVKVGFKDSQWQKKIASLLDATLPYSRVDSASAFEQPNISWRWLSRVYNPYDGQPPSYRWAYVRGDPTSVILDSVLSNHLAFGNASEARSLAKLDFLSKVREHQSSFQVLPFLGELRETLGMIRHPLKGILRHTSRYRNRVRKLFRVNKDVDKLAERLGNAYLQWTYGVSPLLGDIEGIKETITKLYEEPVVTRLSASKPLDEVPKWVHYEPLTLASSYAQIGRSCLVQRVGKVRFVGAILNKLSGPTLENTREKISANLKDFVPAAYELLPYSFLIDYFSTTGDVLNGVFTDTSSLVYACESTSIRLKGLGIAYGLPSRVGTPMSWPLSPAVGKLEKLSFNRVKADLSVGLRDLRLTTPNTGQIFNTVVLALARFRSG